MLLSNADLVLAENINTLAGNFNGYAFRPVGATSHSRILRAVLRPKHIRLQIQLNQCICGGSTATQITLSGQ